MSEMLALLAFGFGVLGLIFPAFVARRIRRAQMQLRVIVHNSTYTHSDLELSPYSIHLTRLLGGWGNLLGLAITWPYSTYLGLVVAGYTVVSIIGFDYLMLHSTMRRTNVTSIS